MPPWVRGYNICGKQLERKEGRKHHHHLVSPHESHQTEPAGVPPWPFETPGQACPLNFVVPVTACNAPEFKVDCNVHTHTNGSLLLGFHFVAVDLVQPNAN